MSWAIIWVLPNSKSKLPEIFIVYVKPQDVTVSLSLGVNEPLGFLFIRPASAIFLVKFITDFFFKNNCLLSMLPGLESMDQYSDS